jgi:hypothetical protein
MSTTTRIQALLSRATHPETPPEEARTSAMLACALIVKDGALERLSVFEAHAVELRRKQAAQDRPAPESAPGDSRYRIILAKYDAICRVCVGDINQNERVAWRKGWGTAHVGCMRDVKGARVA